MENRSDTKLGPIAGTVDTLEFSCPLCSRRLVLWAKIVPAAWVVLYATVTIECRGDQGEGCGWKGSLLLREGEVIDASLHNSANSANWAKGYIHVLA